MIKLFVTDLDGCIAHPFVTPDWEAISRIRKLNLLSETDSGIPPLTILSGRPLPFVEAVGQWLGVRLPMVFEGGGGMYQFRNNELSWNAFFDMAARQAIVEIKEWMEKHLISRYENTIAEFTKLTDAGLINPDTEKIKRMYKQLQGHIEQHYPAFEVHFTEISINVILKDANKGSGLQNLCAELNIGLHEVAYIGDSGGDVPALKIAGKAFAPGNATAGAKEAAHYEVAEATLGVLEAYEKLIAWNKAEER